MESLLALGLAFVCSFALARVKVPPLVGYLLAGVIFSAMGYHPSADLHELGEIGVLFLLFGVGLHIRLDHLLNLEIFLVGFGHLLIGVLIFIGVTVWFGLPPDIAVFMGLVLGFSSTVLAAKVLEERGELGARHARYAIGILILQDIIAIALMAYLGVGAPSWNVLLVLLLPLCRPLIHRILTWTDHGDVILLYGIILALGGGHLFAYLQLPAELGAIAMGAMLAGHPRMEELGSKIWGVRESLLILFFFTLGSSASISLENIGYASLILVILPFKALLFHFLFLLVGMRARTAFLTGLALTTYSEFALIAGQIALDSGLIGQQIVSVMALSVALSFAINVPINRVVNWIYIRYEPYFLLFERERKIHDIPATSRQAQYVVVGMGRTGRAAYDQLGQSSHVVGVEVDQTAFEVSEKSGRIAVYGDAQDPDVWQRFNIEHIKGVVLAMPNLESKLHVLQVLNKLNFKGKVSALSIYHEEDEMLRAHGAMHVCHALREAGVDLASAIHEPG